MDKKTALEQFHKNQLLLTAEVLFLKQGVEATTLDQIAKEAGYSKTTLYTYFKSKQALFYGTAYENIIRLKQTLAEIVQLEADFFDSYFSFCQTLAAYQENYPIYFSALLHPEVEATETSQLNNFLVVVEELSDLLEALLKKGVAEGRLSDSVKFPEIVYILWSAITSIISTADQKAACLSEQTSTDKSTFRYYGFKMLLQGVI
ncbi:TetR/AcrR family transcriptional regulator [Enterococcus sp. LJL128]|uniref:TetR/AcrR family transcriptional regulator n=1 Tax=Enterococcus sp. LJL51 TaxID=3416656 RepID=UPI003CEAFDD0